MKYSLNLYCRISSRLYNSIPYIHTTPYSLFLILNISAFSIQLIQTNLKSLHYTRFLNSINLLYSRQNSNSVFTKCHFHYSLSLIYLFFSLKQMNSLLSAYIAIFLNNKILCFLLNPTYLLK